MNNTNKLLDGSFNKFAECDGVFCSVRWMLLVMCVVQVLDQLRDRFRVGLRLELEAVLHLRHKLCQTLGMVFTVV